MTATAAKKINRAHCEALDADDLLREHRERFDLPERTVYLDGNSLGALPKATAQKVAGLMNQQWGQALIGS